MESLFTQPLNFEILGEEEMGQVKGGVTPDGKDIFDPDEHLCRIF